MHATMETKPDIQNHHTSSSTATTNTNGVNSNNPSNGIVQQSSQNSNSSQICAGCGKHIIDRYLLRALDLLWHEDCLKCK